MTNQPEDDPEVRSQVFRAWARGITPAGLAATYGLEIERVQEIVREQAEKHPLPSQRTPLEVIRDQMIRIEAVLEELAAVAAKGDVAVRVRALAVRFKVLTYEFELYQALGVVPRQLSDLAVHMNGRQIAERLLDALEKRNLLDDELIEDVLSSFEPEDPIPEVPLPPELQR